MRRTPKLSKLITTSKAKRTPLPSKAGMRGYGIIWPAAIVKPIAIPKAKKCYATAFNSFSP